MQLIIAEKKLAAYAYATALSPQFKEHDGYLVGDNQKIYVWAQGHLLTYLDPGEIREEWEEWNWEQLPIIPEKIPRKPIKSQEKQLYRIQSLAKQCTEIINGMDCAGEGEAIYRALIHYLQLNHIPSRRLWTSSLQATAIQEAYSNLKPLQDYDNLARSALLRGKLDYLVGINTSRILSLVGNGKTLPMGRLIGSTLALVHQREQVRATFEEESYYTIKAAFKQNRNIVTANYAGERITDKEKLGEILDHLNNNVGQLDYTDQIKMQLPPILLNHTDILVIIHQRYGMKPKATSSILESLYLKGYVSYPRSQSRYVTKDEITPMRATYRILREVYPNLAKGGNMDALNVNNARLVNIVSDHHAIIPTPAVPTNLSEEEKWVYQLIVERFFLQAQQPKKSNVRKVDITYTEDILFKTRFQITLEEGWKGLELNFSHDEDKEINDEIEDSEMPVESFLELDKGAHVEFIESSAKTSTTKPPGAYTEGTLIKQMENISSIVENPVYKKVLKDCGIGTSATRAETIEKLQDIGYLAIEKKKLVVTPLGENVLGLLDFEQARQIISPEMTAMWEIALEEIKEGKPPLEFELSIINFLKAFIVQMKEQAKIQIKTHISAHECPECKSGLTMTKKTYKCTSCDFFIWRTQYFKTLTPKMLDDLLKKGETTPLTFTSKDKKTKYKAKLTLPIEKGKVKMAFI